MEMKRLVLLGKGYWDTYVRKDFTNKSASLSFYTIISIFPIVLVLTTFLGHFVRQDVLIRETMRLIEQFFPFQNPMIFKTLEALFAKRRTFSWFGGLALLFSSRLLYLNLERIVNELLETGRKRNYLFRRLFFFVWLIGTMLVLLTPLLLGAVRKTLSVFDLFVPAAFASKGIFLLSSFLMFFCVVAIVPTRRIAMKRMVMGSLIFAGGLLLGQMGFKTFTARSVAQYNLVYGSLASVILGAVWIFYFYQMFLILIYWTGRHHDGIEPPAVAIRTDYAKHRK